MKIKMAVLLCGLLSANAMVYAEPLGTAFTYQGQLQRNEQPATNGIYGLRFSLYSAANTPPGVLIGSASEESVPVTNGIFSITLDFGAGAFTGEARWLEISVNTNTVSPTPGYLILLPRMRITPAPSAIYASTAGAVSNGAIQAFHLATVGAPGPGQVLGYNGSSLAWLPPDGISSVWTLNGNNVYYNGGNVGIGTVNPLSMLHVNLPNPGGVGVFVGDRTPFGRAQFETDISLPANTSHAWFAEEGDRVFSVELGGSGYFKGSVIISSNLYFGNQTRQMLNLWNTDYGIGVQNFALYSRSAGGFAWHQGGGHSDSPNDPGAGGSTLMTLDDDFLTIRGFADEQAYIGGDGSGGDVQIGSRNSTVANIALYNTGNNTFMNLGARDVSCRVLTIYGGADLAEPFPMKEEAIEKGSVVVIDDEDPGRLKRSTRAYDTRVAGILSGANGIDPGIALKQQGMLDQGENVALTGRVYVKADASFGAIKPGDLLTTSDTPGHAMKVTEHAKAQGAVLGKAMSALAEGKGLVLVLVTLQ